MVRVRATEVGMPAKNERGFTLVECLVALAILGFVLVIAATLLTAVVRSTKRLAAQQVLLRAAETMVEGVRAGALPLRPGHLQISSGPGGATVSTTLEVERLEVRGLYAVTVSAEGTFAGETMEYFPETGHLIHQNAVFVPRP